jgi:hypothetical protein
VADDKLERAKDQALGKHDDHPGVADHVGEATGGIGGVTAGAAIGSIAGPIGTVIGGIAGAVGGWWAGRAVAEAATAVTTDDDDYYRKHYEASPTRMADRSYDQVRPAYHLGHIASGIPTTAAGRSTTSTRTFAEGGRRTTRRPGTPCAPTPTKDFSADQKHSATLGRGLQTPSTI